MKQLYVCEKCGAQFENWDEANTCENSHLTPYDGYMRELDNRRTYEKGSVYPDKIAIAFRVWENDAERYQYVWYKKAAEFGKKELAEITAEREARERREEEQREQWRKEREARKALEAQKALEAENMQVGA